MRDIIKDRKVVTTDKVRGITCDQCSSVICDIESPKDEEVVFYWVHTYHHDWANDSGESSGYIDLCSRKCLSDNMGEYFSEANGSECYDVERKESGVKYLIQE